MVRKCDSEDDDTLTPTLKTFCPTTREYETISLEQTDHFFYLSVLFRIPVIDTVLVLFIVALHETIH